MKRMLLAVAGLLLASSVTAYAQTASFQKNLSLGSTGPDVVSLQDFLKAGNFLAMPDGVLTGYFGQLTRKALSAYQTSAGIAPANGYFGPITRAKINASVASMASAVPATIPVSQTYSVGGQITGLTGPVTLANNGETLTLAPGQGADFTFPTKLGSGDKYAVTVARAPSGEECFMPSGQTGAGIMGGADVTNIVIECTTSPGWNPFMAIPLARRRISVASAPTGTPTASISIASASVNDDSGVLLYTVTLDHAVTGSTSINFSVSGTAVAGTDFTPVTSPLVIPSGQTTGVITINTIPHTTIESDRTVTVDLHSGTGYTVAGSASVTGTITNDDTPAGNTLYLSWNGTEFSGSGDEGSYELLNPVGPLTIVNTDTSVPLNVVFVGSFTFNNEDEYIMAGSDNIRFGSQTLDNTGSPAVFAIDNVTNFQGLINPNGFSNIVVMNVFVHSVSSTLINGSGWIAGEGASNMTIINSGSDGTISTFSGGLVGSNATNVTVAGSFSTGVIDGYSGGIFGKNAQNVVVESSFSTGSLSNPGPGGILGAYACLNSTNCTDLVRNSFSTGAIGGSGHYNAGGIVGSEACSGATGCRVAVADSYSTGTIYGDGSGSNGGIVGASAADVVVADSYSTGSIGQGSGGIFESGSNLSADDSSSTGTIAMYGGGIFGANVSDSTATNTYSWGNIADNAGGIFGANANDDLAMNSYSIGIYPAGGGGMFGASSVNSTASNCYVFGSNIFGDGSIGQVAVNCFTETSLAWNDVNADSVLSDGAGWTSTAPNTPFVFPPVSISLATPYSTVSVNSDLSLNDGVTETIEKGNSTTVSALSANTDFSIISVSGGTSADYSDITINPSTGIISTTADIAGGAYDILVGWTNPEGAPSMSIFDLIVNN